MIIMEYNFNFKKVTLDAQSSNEEVASNVVNLDQLDEIAKEEIGDSGCLQAMF